MAEQPTRPLPRDTPKPDKPYAWGVLAAVSILMAVTDYNEFVVMCWWVVLIWAFVVNPSARAKLTEMGEKREAEKLAKKQAKRTQHIYHHYERPEEPRV